MITVEEFLASKKQKYKYVEHTFDKRAGGKPVCSGCGLMKLRNKATELAVKRGCLHDLHPSVRKS